MNETTAAQVDETARLLHELQVHRIELQAQNEELREARRELEGALAKYRTLFEFAPLGYLTHDRRGRIADCNQAAATLLRAERACLAGSRLGAFVCEEDVPLVRAHLKRVCRSGIAEIELRLGTGSAPVPVQLHTVAMPGTGNTLFQTALTDLSHHHAMSKTLRESEERYRLLFEHSIDPTFLSHVDGRIIAANPAACLMLGMTEQEICRAGRDGLVDAADPRVAAMLAERARAGTVTTQLAIKAKDGTLIPVDFESVVLPDGSGRLFAIARDITERLRAEQALTRSQRSLAEAQRIARIGDWEWQLASGEVRWSAELYAIYGLDPARYLPRAVFCLDYVHPNDRRTAERALELAASEGVPFNIDVRIKSADGYFRILNCIGKAAACDGQGRPTLLVGVNQDITGRKRIEEALRQSEERFRTIFEEGPLGAVVVSIDYRFVEINRRFCAMLGYSEEELRGRTFIDVTHPDDLVETVIQPTMLLKGESSHFSLDKRYLHKDGSAVWVTVTAWLMRDRHGAPAYFIATVEDITEKKKLHQLRILSAKWDERAKVRKRILDYQERLRKLATQLSMAQEEERRRLAVELHDSIGQNLAFCKLKIGQFQLAAGSAGRQLTEVMDTIDDCIAATRSLSFELSPAALFDLGLEPALQWLARLQTTRSGVAITVTGTKHRVIPLAARILLFQAAREFIANVVKHARAARAEIALSQTEKAIVLTVHDDGVGFDTRTTGRGPDSGAGFGLFNIREQLKNAGGSLEIRSAPAGGTTALVVLPVRAAARRRGLPAP